jgi:hypothetical protein
MSELIKIWSNYDMAVVNYIFLHMYQRVVKTIKFICNSAIETYKIHENFLLKVYFYYNIEIVNHYQQSIIHIKIVLIYKAFNM